MSSESKSLFNTVNTLDDICKKAQESNKLKFKLKKSIIDIKEILKDRTEQLKLKENKFKYHDLADKKAIEKLFEVITFHSVFASFENVNLIINQYRIGAKVIAACWV